MDRSQLGKWKYSGGCVAIPSAEKPKQRWSELVMECLMEWNANLFEAKRMVHSGNLQGGLAQGMSPTMTRHRCEVRRAFMTLELIFFLAVTDLYLRVKRRR